MHALAGSANPLRPGVAAALLDFCWSATQPASRSEMAGNCCPADMNRTGFQYVLEKHSEGDRAPDCQEEIMDPALTPRCHRTV
jgi:hypothetical protein